MLYFIDSASPEKIAELIRIYPFDGITTNPTILAREKAELLSLLRRLRVLAGERPLFVQVTAKNPEEMLLEAKTVREKIGGSLCIKVPACESGMAAVRLLVENNFSVTATAVYTPQQALLFARAGVSYVAPYLSHIDNTSVDSAEVAGSMARLLAADFPKTKVLAASFRVAMQIGRAEAAGVGAVTIAPEMFRTLVSSRETELEIEAFDNNWKAAYDGKTITELLSTQA